MIEVASYKYPLNQRTSVQLNKYNHHEIHYCLKFGFK